MDGETPPRSLPSSQERTVMTRASPCSRTMGTEMASRPAKATALMRIPHALRASQRRPSVEVIVDISHSYQGDLAVELRSASGVSATLHDRSGGSTDDLVGTYATTGGSLTPVDSLYVFTNEPGNGTWSLEIEDRAIFDNGTLNSWTLTLYCMD